jgi:hypothetical protein
VRRNDPPAFRETYPQLTLSTRDCPRVHRALEFERDAAVVASESNDVQAPNRPRQVHGGAALAKSRDLVDAVRFSVSPKRMARGEAQNICVKVSASLVIRAASYRGYSACSSATVSGSLICMAQKMFKNTFRKCSQMLRKVSSQVKHVWESPRSP